jgi:hypothetical protein
MLEGLRSKTYNMGYCLLHHIPETMTRSAPDTERLMLHAVPRTTKVAFLAARKAIQSIADKAGLDLHEAELGFTSNEDMQELQVRLERGREKEPFALRAMRNTLLRKVQGTAYHDFFFANTYLAETGFTSCACGYVSILTQNKHMDKFAISSLPGTHHKCPCYKDGHMCTLVAFQLHM